MKPQECVKDRRWNCYWDDWRALYRYHEKDCIIGYYKDDVFGIMIVMKTARKYMGMWLNYEQHYRQSYNCFRIIPERIIGKIEKFGKIIDTNEWEKMKMKMIAEAI